jgi:hypothetical protein
LSGATNYFARKVREMAVAQDLETQAGLNRVLRLTARWRSQMIANTIIHLHGTVVQAGPFAGMEYLGYATEGCLAPRLLGTYEADLHPHIVRLAQEGLDAIIDIGCAEGYYAVGMARLSPGSIIYAHDTDKRAQESCALLAAQNGVTDRVKIGGEFKGEDFDKFSDRSVLLMMDAEGAEDDLLHPDQWPALRGMNIIVETHNMFRPGITNRLVERFQKSHDIEVVNYSPRFTEMPTGLRDYAPLDQLLATWEWRAGPTPWLVMEPKKSAS